jgi:RNA-directed DNA polymerase
VASVRRLKDRRMDDRSNDDRRGAEFRCSERKPAHDWRSATASLSYHTLPGEAVAGRSAAASKWSIVWSPQRYIARGLAAGRDRTLLNRAVEQIERLILPTPSLPAILTLNHLAHRTETNYTTLRNTVEDSSTYYRSFHIRKRSGGRRLINVPQPELMRVQRWLTAHVLRPLSAHHRSFAFSKKASIYRCAAEHYNARWLIKMDVSGFFGSISEIQVYRVYREIGYEPLVSFELTRLTTYAPPASIRYTSPNWSTRQKAYSIPPYVSDRIGFLPQGAPTSPMLSNLVMRCIDIELDAIARAMGLVFTRYSDDITFSTRGTFTRQKAGLLIWRTKRTLAKIGLRTNDRKTTIVPPGARKVVLGLLVDGAHPRLTHEFKSKLRQHLYYLEKYGPQGHAEKRNFDSIWGMYRHIRGLIDFAKMVEPDYAKIMLARFTSLSWPTDMSP